MSATSGKGRLSGIPTPGKAQSSIPTPGRLRSISNATHAPSPHTDDEYIAKAFADAIKANDPGQHRSSDLFTASLSPSYSTHSQSGRHSVTGRPSSSASTSSAFATTSSSASLASSTYARPPSRVSDVPRSASRAGGRFEVGDNVRIESLGFEGTLRYIGEIDGKSGLWAGVQLSGGFAGKGKNNGSVAGKQYFACPPLCGVFVATSKLSAPTVGYGSISRPSSVASTRSGRVTPAPSGRVTPSNLNNGRKTPSYSFSNGRVTPSLTNGRVTPSASTGRKTPATSSRSYTGVSYKPPAITPSRPSNSKDTNITPGSRASKYIGMTAKQLTNRTSGTASPTRSSLSSQSSHLPSPTRSTASPFNTPKAGRTSNIGMGIPSGTPTKSRTSTSTPRHRVPSAIAMPPPASPSSHRTTSHNEQGQRASSSLSLGKDSATSELESNARALNDRIAGLLSGRTSASLVDDHSRPPSATSLTSFSQSMELQSQIDKLQAKVDGLEQENTRLRSSAENTEKTASSRLDNLVEERDKATSRITELEASLRAAERSLNDRDNTIEGLERAVQEASKDIEKTKSDGEARVRDTQSKLDDKEALVNQLKALVEAKEGEQSQNDAAIAAKNAEIEVLGARVQKAYTELEEERRELGGHVDELRKAGQETIALYEERLSAADTRRYEMEDMIASLEEQLRTQARPESPSGVPRFASSAAEIDNESLREQVQHLQRKISSLEDMLEDSRLAAEREESSIRDRIKRSKDREDAMRKEVADVRHELERSIKAEERARERVEEIEEALRENTVALENARADIEGLRMEIAQLEGLTASQSVPRNVDDRSQLQEEIAALKQQLNERSQLTSNDDVQAIMQQLEAERSDKIALAGAHRDTQSALAEMQALNEKLRVQVDERSTELDSMRKKMNRDIPISGLQNSAKTGDGQLPSRNELTALKEEIKGLKHIIQDLQKENAMFAQDKKVLEAENKLLVTETEQLREDITTLEDNVEQKLLSEEQALAAEESTGDMPDNVAILQQTLRDLKANYESEIEQLKKRFTDAEMKNARNVHQLNKEIGELESLIESKIYREVRVGKLWVSIC
ncbi:hypothetical protein C8Q75DRAFT_749538 [Abortiporus biennis]|nr:hypothetical protein C8Q75DRAFT_749538 [Abortiporus biennis]